MLRKALIVALACISCTAGALVQAVVVGIGLAEDPPPVAGAPFSATVNANSVTTFADGTRIVRTSAVQYFRDAQGRTRSERGEGPTRVISIHDPVAKQRYILFPERKLAFAIGMSGTSTVMPGEGQSLEENAPFALLGLGMGLGATPKTESSSETTSLGQKSINGEAATGTRLVRTIPSGVLGNDRPMTSTLDRWVSTDLGIPVQVVQKSSVGGQLTLSLVKVSRGEPDPTLFVPPADYRRAGPSQPAASTLSSTAGAHK